MLDRAKMIAIEQATNFGDGCWLRNEIESMNPQQIRQIANELRKDSPSDKMPPLSISSKNQRDPKENDLVIFGDRKSQGDKTDKTMGTHIFTAHFNQKTGQLETASCRSVKAYSNSSWDFKDYRKK